MRQLMVALALAATPLAASAKMLDNEAFSTRSTEDLVALCSATEADALYPHANVFCTGYIAGVMHYHREITKGPKIKPLFCPEEQVTRGEAVAVFLDWARRNPQYMGVPAVEGVMRAAEERFPCKGGEKGPVKGKRKGK